MFVPKSGRQMRPPLFTSLQIVSIKENRSIPELLYMKSIKQGYENIISAIAIMSLMTTQY